MVKAGGGPRARWPALMLAGLSVGAVVFAAATPSHPNRIVITDALPSTLDLPPSDLLTAWETALSSLTSFARELTESSLTKAKLGSKTAGIPGTGITDPAEAKLLQQHLDCMTSKGEFVYDAVGAARLEESGKTGLTAHKQESIYAQCDNKYYKTLSAASTESDKRNWNVRNSLKWRWVPSSTCEESAPAAEGISRAGSTLSRKQFCTLLAHKSILLVGDTTQFSLHDLLLDWTTMNPQSCYGDLYCKEHSLCGDVLAGEDDAIEDWEEDERVYQKLPSPPNLHEGHDHAKRDLSVNAANSSNLKPAKEKRETKIRSPSYGTLLRYRKSDGLRTSSADTTPVHLHASTGIREMNQPWLPDAKRSDLVIFSKSPLPFPLKGANTTFDAQWDEVKELSASKRAERLIELVSDKIGKIWLPELIETLTRVRESQLIIYRGTWRTHYDCAKSSLAADDSSATWEWNSVGDGPPPHDKQPSLAQLLFRDAKEKKFLVDENSLYYNLQVILQNHLIRTIVLPRFGIPFLDLETPLSVWRSGFVGSSLAAKFQPIENQPGPNFLVDQTNLPKTAAASGLRSSASGDCTRYCIPSPGSAIEEAFIGGLTRIFERGFAGTREREETWVGDGFVKITERNTK